jgi:hypothetical protein
MNEEYKIIISLLPEGGEKFPVGKGIEIVRGKTLSRTNKWWKAILLIKTKRAKEEKYQLRLYAWQKNKKNEYKVRQKFNISLARYLGDVIDILQMFVLESKNEVLLERVYNKLLTRVGDLEKSKIILERGKGKLPELENSLKEFIKLIDRGANERTIAQFLKQNTWIFGPSYRKISKKEKEMTIKSKYDFLLKRMDGYFDILELKKPGIPIFVRTRGNKKVMSNDLKMAISQIIFYLAEARTYYLQIKNQTGFDVYFPKGIIVIGRRKTEEKELLKTHQEFLHNINIFTYDELIDIAKKSIQLYKKGGRR